MSENLFNLVKAKLENSGVEYKLIPLPEDISDDIKVHMRFHGGDLSLAMPNIVFRTEKGLIVAQRRGDTQIDNKKLKKLLGVQKLSLANAEDLKKFNLEPGIVPPLGYNIPIYMDQRVLENDEIYTGTGDKLFAIKLNPHDLIRVSKSTVGDFTKLGETQASGRVFRFDKKRVLSGIRATGRLHLGNYLGAVKGMLALQEDPNYETFYMVADLHTITTPYDKKNLKSDIQEVVLDYLSIGLDPKKSVIFVQSSVPEHVELAYLFSTAVSVARMQHLPTFKEKVKQHPENVTMALLYYPVLMASDILIYRADSVPVGIDQEPHLEIAREIARKMNSQYGTNFPEPRRFATKGEYIPSLTGEGKMSKSVEGSFINLTDDLETIHEKLAKVPTDEGKGDKVPEEGGVAALLKFVELFQGEKKREAYEKQYTSSGVRYSELKQSLAEAIFTELEPVQKRRKDLGKNPKEIEEILKEGAARARTEAQKTLREVKEAMGLL